MIEFFTACCHFSRLLLQDPVHKQILLNSLAFLVREQRIWLYGYVILDDEFHLMWKKQPMWQTHDIRQMMLKYTAQQIIKHMAVHHPAELVKCRSPLGDRQYQFWEKNAFTLPLFTREHAAEKLTQLHEAPVTAGLCREAEQYPYSSADWYHNLVKKEKREQRHPGQIPVLKHFETVFIPTHSLIAPFFHERLSSGIPPPDCAIVSSK